MKNEVTTPSRSRTTENVSGASLHQAAISAPSSGPSCRLTIRSIAACVLGPSRLDGERLHRAREERLPDDRVLDDEEHVRGVAPQLRLARAPDFLAELAPGRAAVRAMAVGVGAVERRVDRGAHGVVDDEPVGARLDERQLRERVDGVLVFEHRLHQRPGDTADNRGGLECAARGGVDVGEVEPGERVDGAVGGVLELFAVSGAWRLRA